MLKFNKTYFILSVVLLALEIVIAVYAHDAYIRPFAGDFFVVMLIYCFIRSFAGYNVNRTLIGVLLFAYVLEVLQYFHIVNLLRVQDVAAARIMIGTNFAWTDMLMYTLGVLLAWLIERRLKRV